MDAARLTIGTWPTPTQRMERASDLLGREIWVKVEEECGAWGGNKVRKLEYILAAAERDGIDTLIGYGAGTSNWTAALVHHAVDRGFHVVVGMAGLPAETYRHLYDRAEVTPVVMRSTNALPLVIARARLIAGRGARSIPMGGSGYGDIGCVHVGAEIADAVRSGAVPRPDAAFVAVGTGGTAAGTAAGLAINDEPIRLVGVKVAPWPFGTEARVRRHATRLLGRLGRDAQLLISGDRRFFKPGYARANDPSLEATEIARLDGLQLDGAYAAKAFAGVVASARSGPGGPLLFIHTSPGPPPR